MDLARLGFDFDGQGAAAAEQAYGRLESGAKGVESATTRAERATERLSRAARGLDPAVNDVAAAMRQQRQVMDAVRHTAGLTTNETLNLSRQFADVGVSIASGMPIWMVAIQQGSQIGDTFQMAAQRGVSFRMALDSIYLRLAPLLAPLAAIGVAVGAVSSMFALAARDVNKGSAEMIRDLNLTEDQMKKLKKSGEDMGVTMGDVFRGLGTTIAEVLGEAFGPQIDQATSAWSKFLDDLGHNTMNEIRTIVGAFTGAYGAIKAAWSMLPAALGDAAYTAARATVGSIEWLVNKSIDGVNQLLGAMRQLSAINPAFSPARAIGDINHVQFGRPDNPYAGAMSATAAAGQAGFDDYQARGESWVNSTADRARGNIEDSWEARQRGGAGDPGEEAAKKAREVRENLRQFGDADLTPLTRQLEHAITPLDEMAHRMGVINDLTRDMAFGFESAFGQGGRAVGEMMKVMSSYQAQMAAWAAEEADMVRRNQMDYLRLQEIEAQRAAASVAQYGDMLGAAKGFFAEGSDGYKALQTAEQAYRVFQFAMMVQAMVMGGQETAATVGQNAIKALSHGVVAVARAMASLPFPLNLAAGAATIAALAAIGVKIAGGGGSGGGSSAAPVGDQVLTNRRLQAQGSLASGPAAGAQGSPWGGTQVFDMRGAVVTEQLMADVNARVAAGEARVIKAVPKVVNRGIAKGRIGEPAWGVG